jgi:alpha-1,3/alpha-1,6-mannosyltransferase
LRVSENVEYHKELRTRAQTLGLTTATLKPGSPTDDPPDADVVFVLSFAETQRTFLLSSSLCLLYTPSNEHFGIVPVEAMYARLPVVAVNSGGPVESIADGETGYLCEPNAEAFADAIEKVEKLGEDGRRRMGEKGRERVIKRFSLDAMIDKIEKILHRLVNDKGTKIQRTRTNPLVVFLVPLLIALLLWRFMSR